MTTDLITQSPPDELLPIISQILGEEAISYDPPTAKKIGRSVGQATAGIFQVTGHAQTRTGNHSWSAVVKIFGDPEIPRPEQLGDAMMELQVYRSGVFAELCGRVRAPRCYAIPLRDGLHLMWLEDLSGAPQPPWQPEHFVAVAHNFGSFNAHWPQDSLPDWEWLDHTGFRSRFIQSHYQKVFNRLPQIQENSLVRRAIPSDLLNRLQQMWEDSDTLLTQAEASSPQGVCHGDCHAKNLFPMNDARDGSYTVAIDWAHPGIDCYGLDIALLLSSAVKWLELSPDNAVSLVDPIFTAYVEGLGEAGWSGDEDEVRLVYLSRLGCEAMRVSSIMVNMYDAPQNLEILARFFGTPIEEIYNQWANAHRFYLRCHDEAMELAGLR